MIASLNLIIDIFVVIVCIILAVNPTLISCEDLSEEFAEDDEKDVITRACNMGSLCKEIALEGEQMN